MRIYVSYRREDRARISRLFSRLVGEFGADNVLVNESGLDFSNDYRRRLESRIARCDLMLVVIGQGWMRAEYYPRRLSPGNSADLVRLEMESASATRTPMVPVLIDGVALPDTCQLTPTLRNLLQQKPIELPERDCKLDCALLFDEMRAQRRRRREVVGVDRRPAGQQSAFISHCREDREWAERNLVYPLRSRGVTVWYSKTSIGTATQWEREILRGLEDSGWFLLVVSPRSAASEWVKDELNWAMDNRPNRIIPLIMEQCSLWEFHIRLPRIQYVDFTDDACDRVDRLVAIFDAAL